MKPKIEPREMASSVDARILGWMEEQEEREEGRGEGARGE